MDLNLAFVGEYSCWKCWHYFPGIWLKREVQWRRFVYTASFVNTNPPIFQKTIVETAFKFLFSRFTWPLLINKSSKRENNKRKPKYGERMQKTVIYWTKKERRLETYLEFLCSRKTNSLRASCILWVPKRICWDVFPRKRKESNIDKLLRKENLQISKRLYRIKQGNKKGCKWHRRQENNKKQQIAIVLLLTGNKK